MTYVRDFKTQLSSPVRIYVRKACRTWENVFHSSPKPDCLENQRPQHFSFHHGRTINHFLVMILFIAFCAGGSACYFRQLIKRCLRVEEEFFCKDILEKKQTFDESINLGEFRFRFLLFSFTKRRGWPRDWIGKRSQQESAAYSQINFPWRKIGVFHKVLFKQSRLMYGRFYKQRNILFSLAKRLGRIFYAEQLCHRGRAYSLNTRDADDANTVEGYIL